MIRFALMTVCAALVFIHTPSYGHAAEGTLDKQVIKALVQKHQAEIKQCYEAGLREDPSLEGKVVVDFTIGSAGDVVQATIKESTLGREDIDACLINVVNGWRFEPPKGGGVVRVSYPFVFKTTDG